MQLQNMDKNKYLVLNFESFVLNKEVKKKLVKSNQINVK